MGCFIDLIGNWRAHATGRVSYRVVTRFAWLLDVINRSRLGLGRSLTSMGRIQFNYLRFLLTLKAQFLRHFREVSRLIERARRHIKFQKNLPVFNFNCFHDNLVKCGSKNKPATLFALWLSSTQLDIEAKPIRDNWRVCLRLWRIN